MSEGDDFVAGLVKHPEILLDVAQADGAAILHDGNCFRVGTTPEQAEVDAIADWLATENRGDVFATDSLARQMPRAADPSFKDAASGLLAVAISQLHRGYILWFRPEVLQTDSWGGDPRKNAPAADGRIHPRRSFEAWKETVRLKSAPWRPSEVEPPPTTSARRSSRSSSAGPRSAPSSAAELERSNKELEAFSYSVSHDLRAPFRHIVGYAELLSEVEEATLSPEGKRYLATIVESAQFAGTLVDNLLAFSRMGRTSIHPVPINMDSLVREVVREVQSEVGAGRSVDWQIGDLPAVEGDLMMLRLAMTNLVSNAAKYTRKQSHAVIDIAGTIQGNEVIFQVKDNGIGFDMRHVDKLFGVFQRLHRMEEFEGTGIGLANVRRIMSRHGGRAWAQGELNRGATFSIALPRRTAGETVAPEPRGALMLKPILLVEDNPKDVELSLVALGKTQLANEVIVVRDGAEALDYLRCAGQFAERAQGNPSIVLLDLKLPKIDGLQVLEQIKSDPDLQAIPVVMLTASREEKDLLRSYKTGVNAYVVKPVSFKEFIAAIQDLGVFWALLNEPPPGQPETETLKLGAGIALANGAGHDLDRDGKDVRTDGPARRGLPNVSQINLLHLEDSSLDAELIRVRLAKEGLKLAVHRVVGHDDYLAALRPRRFDLILADYSLPGFDGLKALEYARSTPDTPFLFVSGVLGRRSRDRDPQAGGDRLRPEAPARPPGPRRPPRPDRGPRAGRPQAGWRSPSAKASGCTA